MPTFSLHRLSPLLHWQAWVRLLVRLLVLIVRFQVVAEGALILIGAIFDLRSGNFPDGLGLLFIAGILLFPFRLLKSRRALIRYWGTLVGVCVVLMLPHRDAEWVDRLSQAAELRSVVVHGFWLLSNALIVLWYLFHRFSGAVNPFFSLYTVIRHRGLAATLSVIAGLLFVPLALVGFLFFDLFPIAPHRTPEGFQFFAESVMPGSVQVQFSKAALDSQLELASTDSAGGWSCVMLARRTSAIQHLSLSEDGQPMVSIDYPASGAATATIALNGQTRTFSDSVWIYRQQDGSSQIADRWRFGAAEATQSGLIAWLYGPPGVNQATGDNRNFNALNGETLHYCRRLPLPDELKGSVRYQQKRYYDWNVQLQINREKPIPIFSSVWVEY